MNSERLKKLYIDSSAVLGMHSGDDKMRRESVNFFVTHFNSTIYMSLEQVGYCDDVIWRFPRSLQDQYYPFMDRLHTEMDIRRVPYTYKDLSKAMHDEELSALNTSRALIAAQVLNNDAVLYTHDSVLLSLEALGNHIGQFTGVNDLDFETTLNGFYKHSQVLKINPGESGYA